MLPKTDRDPGLEEEHNKTTLGEASEGLDAGDKSNCLDPTDEFDDLESGYEADDDLEPEVNMEADHLNPKALFSSTPTTPSSVYSTLLSPPVPSSISLQTYPPPPPPQPFISRKRHHPHHVPPHTRTPRHPPSALPHSHPVLASASVPSRARHTKTNKVTLGTHTRTLGARAGVWKPDQRRAPLAAVAGPFRKSGSRERREYGMEEVGLGSALYCRREVWRAERSDG
ncbi:hypothetical protein BU16DRAFT_581344 [Lophium mytilinum]|uniref:Uncharacterized protein n=1 Tax=Lophium mytilinum TaxID=390894 RepID=A0A6A6QUM8_9PEZI|nr:hypothetical protein BU16DRAFT_581344 [Lophium mytilinum]